MFDKNKKKEIINMVLDQDIDKISLSEIQKEAYLFALNEKPFWASKKFIITFLSMAVPTLNHLFRLGLNVEEIVTTITPAIAYVTGLFYKEKRVENISNV